MTESDFKGTAKAIEAWAKPADTLTKRFSAGTGWFDPSHKRERNIAKNENRIRDALSKVLSKQIKKQDNLDKIGQIVLPMLSPNAKLDEMSLDWLVFWGERASLSSDERVRLMWAKIFSGEAESPNSFSKWALNAVSCMTKEDIDAFTKLASCVWMFGPSPMGCEVVYWPSSRKIISLSEYVLERTGLVRGFSSPLEGRLSILNQRGYIQYFDRKYGFRFPDSLEVPRGTALSLTLLGKELYPLCDATPNERYRADCIAQWKSKGIELIHTYRVA